MGQRSRESNSSLRKKKLRKRRRKSGENGEKGLNKKGGGETKDKRRKWRKCAMDVSVLRIK